MTHDLFLDLYYEPDVAASAARDASGDLNELLARLAPHVRLTIDVRAATSTVPWSFEWNRSVVDAVRHEPSGPGRQSVLITDHALSGAQGWGTCKYGVVSGPRMAQKRARGGASVDIVVHEWMHTIQGVVINGRPVPFADDAEAYGFAGESGVDGELRWDAWYAYALGVGPTRVRHTA